MTPNDAQIDLLMKRYAQRAKPGRVAQHLDADQLNAFAEGALPEATRASFVVHLADCDDCRRIATSLVGTSGVIASASVLPDQAKNVTWRKKLMALFAPARLRYAAFAMVLLAAATVTFVALQNRGARQASETSVEPSQTRVAEVTQSQQSKPESFEDKIAKSGTVAPQATQSPKVLSKRDESPVAVNTEPATAKSSAEPAAPAEATNKAAEPRAARALPSYAPVPPGETEREQNRSREQQNVGGLTSRKDESANTNFSALDRARSGESRRNRGAEQNERAAADQPTVAARQTVDDKSLFKLKENDALSVGAKTQELRVETRKVAPKKAATSTASAETVETLSIGGHKFRRQANGWVDTKYKTSMSVKNVSRGSDEYRDLDAGLRSIAEQISGSALIVWKGKAYQIR